MINHAGTVYANTTVNRFLAGILNLIFKVYNLLFLLVLSQTACL